MKPRLAPIILLMAAGALVIFTPKGPSQALGAGQPVIPRFEQVPPLAGNKFKMPLAFEEVRDPDGRVDFFCRGPGYELLLTPKEAVCLYPEKRPARPASPSRKIAKPEAIPARVVSMQWMGANPTPRMVALEKMQGYRNYYVGSQPEKWRTRVPLYRQAKYEGIYPGIDLVYYEKGGRLEYDFVVAPGADPKKIHLAFRGIDQLSLDKKGNLVLHVGKSRIVQRAPVVYQEVGGVQKQVNGRYRLMAKNQVGFALGAYDSSQPVVIDPTLDFLTYLGGSEAHFSSEPAYSWAAGGFDQAHDAAMDSRGNVYVIGHTLSFFEYFSPGDSWSSRYFPVTGWPVALPSLFMGEGLFLTKFSPTGELLVSTLIDGRFSESGTGIAVDEAGNVYLTGYTFSDDFPISAINAYQSVFRGPGLNTFVMKLDSDFHILYSTYFGSGGTGAYAIAADNSGHAYVTGMTGTGLPIKNAFMSSSADPAGFEFDAWVAKFDTNQTGEDSLVYSTLLGGCEKDGGTGIAIDSAGHAYVSGWTASNDFPLCNSYAGSGLGPRSSCMRWAFVSKINPDGGSLLYSTFLSNSIVINDWSVDPIYYFPNVEFPRVKIAADNTGHVYVTGGIVESHFPTRNGYRDILHPDITGAPTYIVRLNTNLSGDASLVYSTFLGAPHGTTQGSDIVVDTSGKVYVTGFTRNGDFPVRGPFRPPAISGGYDIFLAKFDTNLTGDASLIWSTYLGGTGEDIATAMALGTGVAVAGFTKSPDLPVTPGAFQSEHANVENYDAFVMKWSDPVDTALPLPETPSIFYIPRLQFSVLRANPSECVPFGAVSASRGKLQFQAALPKFSGPVNVYLALTWGEEANANTGQALPSGPHLYFADFQGNLLPAGQGRPVWQAEVDKGWDRLVSLDISALPVDAENLNLILLIEPLDSPPQSDVEASFNLQVPYYAWVVRVPVPQPRCKKVRLSLQNLLGEKRRENSPLIEAISFLETSLLPVYWQDIWTPGDKQVFVSYQQAVRQLLKLRSQNEVVEEAVKIVVETGLTLAANTIVDAIEHKAQPQKIRQARKFMAKAGKELAAENFGKTVNLYGQAWMQAEEALQEVESSPNTAN